MAFQRHISQVLHRLVQRRVGGDTDDVELAVLELLHRDVEHRFVDVGEHHLHALDGETLTKRATDPGCAARHDGNLPGQVPHSADRNRGGIVEPMSEQPPRERA